MARQQKRVQLFDGDPQNFVNNLKVFYSQFYNTVGVVKYDTLTKCEPMRIDVG